ncbi:unnamed protein product [Arctogadus glacialis]
MIDRHLPTTNSGAGLMPAVHQSQSRNSRLKAEYVEESGGGPGPGLGRAPLLHGPHQAFNNTPARSRATATLLIGLSGSRCGGSGFFTEQRATWRRSPLER